MVTTDGPRQSPLVVTDPIPVLDSARFAQMQRIAIVMGESGLIPESLCKVNDEWLPSKTIIARCFLIVNQAVGWRMDPFAVAQCASVVHGRVCYEGKLIAAVLDNLLGVRLAFEWNGETGDKMGVTVSATIAGEKTPRTLSGTVGEWKTDKKGSPWGKQPRMMLAYRGARDWARLHAPAAMLGVYSIDEMEDAVSRQGRLPPPSANGSSSEPPRPPSARLEPPEPPTPPEPPQEPPAPAAAPPTPDGDWLEQFRSEANAAPDETALNRLYDATVAIQKPAPEDQDEMDAIVRESGARFWVDTQEPPTP